jgi:hypothetical protein
MPRTWSPEQRAELAERQKARWAKKRTESAIPTDQLNPVANEVLLEPNSPPERLRPKRLEKVPLIPADSPLDLIRQLENFAVDKATYQDCGLLLNALSAATTRIALARRQKQEQLEAGTHRAPCKTCGRMIDISKPGGFQILTERDEHFMPRNTYYCSQNCLLARNMPSHARSTPKEKKENRA